ncbi:small hydrophilic protein [Streptomyces sp. SID4948]|nr:small hydrophilic protein [Streptomyces sp. SID4948]
MREQARKAGQDAERTGDPAERERLRQQARQLESDSEQESMMAAGDIYPTE